MGGGAKKKKPPQPRPRRSPRRGTGTKRTPQTTFDPAAGKDFYEPEKVVAQRIIKGGVSQYQVKWTGYESKHNTWEPLVFVMLVYVRERVD